MDPTENYRRQIDLARRILEIGEDLTDPLDSALELAEYVVALHNWLAEGGFQPDRKVPRR